MPKVTRSAARNKPQRQAKELGSNGWPTGQVTVKILGGASSPCITRNISDYPPEEQERMMMLFKPAPNIPKDWIEKRRHRR